MNTFIFVTSFWLILTILIKLFKIVKPGNPDDQLRRNADRQARYAPLNLESDSEAARQNSWLNKVMNIHIRRHFQTDADRQGRYVKGFQLQTGKRTAQSLRKTPQTYNCFTCKTSVKTCMCFHICYLWLYSRF